MPHEFDPDALHAAEADIRRRLADQPVDIEVQRATSNLYRAASVVSRRAEREMLGDLGLSWSAFVSLWVLWVWGEMEAAPLASECNLAKGTLTGMLTTLEKQELVRRTQHPADKRRVLVGLTDTGYDSIEELYPQFNQLETAFTQGLDDADKVELARLLRRVITNAEDADA